MTTRRSMHTDDLIKALSASAPAVSPLRSPHARTATWFAISLIYAALVVVVAGPRPDLVVKLAEPKFVIEVAAALLTSMLAAAAAFCAGCPGRPLWERFAPLPALALWLGSLGTGCWQSWMRAGPDGLSLAPDLICFPSILLVSIVPGLLILAMVRRGAPIAPVTTTMLAALASAALGAAALRLFHTQDASVMVLVWQFGSVMLLTLVGALLGRSLLRWPQEGALE
ncbi:MAG: DUF1109 domain-containing protein [Pseudomonadota bacterium]